MGEILYLDCSSGIAGDMLVGALLDLGADEGAVRRAVDSLPVEGVRELRVSRVSKHGIDACDFDVVLEPGFETHDHDMAWLHGAPGHAHDGGHGHAHGHGSGHAHEHDHGHDHGHGHGHDHDDHGRHVHRGLADVMAVLDAADMGGRAREIATRAFGLLARGEAAAHGTTPELVHFHEVGAVDSIVDVVAASVCLESLGVDRVVVSPLAEGRGTIRCAHGIMPVPVPAVVNVARIAGLELCQGEVAGELVTPTGAALAAAIRTDDRLPARFRVRACGTGAGKRDYECPGVLRAMLVEPSGDEGGEPGRVTKLECEVDDATGEALGRTLDALYEAGAREAHFIPVVAKKSRPAWQLQVICLEGDVGRLERVIFDGTTTIGVRRVAMDRTALERRVERVATPLGPVLAKVVTLPDGAERAYPEFDDVARLADEAGASLQDAWQAAQGACAALVRG